MDSEDIREESTYQKCVAELAARRRLRRVMGVLVHFGYYQAHEDDPEKAVRDRAQAGHCSKQSKEPRSCRHAWQATGLLLKFD